nr:DALR anticodon-binding domain-containing protein [Acidobacteriota bacterium]
EETQRKIARQIAIGALRYFLLKFTRTTVIIFDFKEALAFEGETGTYCQNATVRINSIFRKLDANAVDKAFEIVSEKQSETSGILQHENEVWSLATLALRFEDTIAQAISATEPAILAKYTFNLAKAFNLFYHNHKIIVEENEFKRAVLIVVAEIARRSLTASLNTLGIEVPERM